MTDEKLKEIICLEVEREAAELEKLTGHVELPEGIEKGLFERMTAKIQKVES